MTESIFYHRIALGGFNLKPRRSSGPVFNGIGNGGGATGRRSTLLTISGYTGSGKSALARMLVRRLGYQMLTLATTRPASRVEQNGLDYHFVSEAEFMDGLQKGEMIGCEGGYGSYYGVPRIEIEKLTAAGKNGVVVAGASLMDSLRAYCQGRTDVNFRSALVRLPGSSEERFAEVIRRIEKRAREEGRDAAERLDKVSPEALNAYDGRASYYDLELINGDFNSAGQTLRDYVQAVEQGRNIGKTERVLVRNTPQIILTRYLYGVLEKQIQQEIGKIDLSTYASIGAGINERLTKGVSQLLFAVYDEYHPGRIPPQEHMAATIKHVLEVTAGILQTKEKIGQLKLERQGIGKLINVSDPDRGLKNAEAVLAVSSKYAPLHLARLALLHDITKAAEWYLHPRRTYEVLNRFDLFRELGLTEEERQLYSLTTRYHVLLSCNIMPDLTGQALIDFLKDPKTREFLSTAGKVDPLKAERLLDSLLLLAIADISPYGAALTNLKFEAVLAHHQRLLRALTNNADDYDTVLTDLTASLPELNRQYLGMILGISDPNMDQQVNLGHYWEIMEGRMDELLSPDEKKFIAENIHLLDTPFQPYNYLARITAEGMITGGLHLQPGKELFKLLSFNIHLARLLKQPDRALHFCMQCADGRYISSKEELQEVAREFFRIMQTATDIPEIEGGRIYIKGPAGERIEGIEIWIDESGVEGARDINFRFLNIK